MKIKSLILALALALASCAPTIKDFNKFQKQFISQTEFMPSEENLSGKAPKVVVFEFDEANIDPAKLADLGNTIAKSVEATLSKNRLAEIVDRKSAVKLQKEVQLAEMNKTGAYKGPRIADYAISGGIANADYASKYSSGSTYINPKNGQIISIPPKYTYTSNVSGNIKIFELPSLQVVEAIEMKGKSVRSENVQTDGGFSLGGIKIGGTDVAGVQRDDGMVRKAGEDAIDEASVDLQNFFAKKGYILEKRSLDKKSIFKINIGSVDGIKHGDKFEVIGQYEVENPISGKSEIERRIIATGQVSQIIDPKNCWIVLDNKDQESLLRIGDMVKLKYSKSTFKSILKIAKNAAQ
jgi:TolB-like protein